MTGIGHTLNIAKGALSAQQYGLSVAGHNIANVNTPSFSRQNLSLTTSIPILFGGLVFGSGVLAEDVRQVSNQMLETRMIEENANLAKFEGAETYVNIVESYFNENTDSSIASLMSEFWNAWQDLSNNPSGFTERGIVFEQAQLISERLNAMDTDLMTLEKELTSEMEAQVNEVNSISEEIAAINQEVVRLQITGSANDQRDKRNALLTELAQHIDIHTFEQDDGAVVVSTANGFSLVNGTDANALQVVRGQINWEGSYGSLVDITGRVSGGRIGGLVEMRDEVVAKYRTDLSMFTRELIWAVNQEHSQGVGLNYFDIPLTGTYKTDSSGLLDTLSYGNKIDYTQDFKMWLQDSSSAIPSYTSSVVDMDLSEAAVTGWTGTAPEADRLKYVFTVTDGGTVNIDGNITLMDGPGLGVVQTGADAASVLDAAIANQTITVFGGTAGAQTITVSDGGDAERSAAAIAASLNSLDGVTAQALQNTAVIDITTLLPPAATSAHPNDLISFTLSSGGRSHAVAFRVGNFDYETRTNFQTAFTDAIADINNFGNNLTVNYSGNTATINSASGENIGIADFDVEDLAVATLDTFQNLGVSTVVDVDTFTNFANGETVDVDITTAQGAVTVSYNITDDTDQTTLATDFENALVANGAALNAIGVTWGRVGGTVTVTGDASAGFVEFSYPSP